MISKSFVSLVRDGGLRVGFVGFSALLAPLSRRRHAVGAQAEATSYTAFDFADAGVVARILQTGHTHHLKLLHTINCVAAAWWARTCIENRE